MPQDNIQTIRDYIEAGKPPAPSLLAPQLQHCNYSSTHTHTQLSLANYRGFSCLGTRLHACIMYKYMCIEQYSVGMNIRSPVLGSEEILQSILYTTEYYMSSVFHNSRLFCCKSQVRKPASESCKMQSSISNLLVFAQCLKQVNGYK